MRGYDNDSPVVEVNKKVLANREKGRKGGLATAKKYSREWIQQRGSKGGCTTRDAYGSDYFRHINKQRRIKRGWPQGKLRKASEMMRQVVRNMGLNPVNQSLIENLLREPEHTI